MSTLAAVGRLDPQPKKKQWQRLMFFFNLPTDGFSPSGGRFFLFIFSLIRLKKRDKMLTKFFFLRWKNNAVEFFFPFTDNIECRQACINNAVYSRNKLPGVSRTMYVIILPDDKINVIIHQMITPIEKEYVIIQPDDTIASVLSSSQMITSMVSSFQRVHLILSQPNHNSDWKGGCWHPARWSHLCYHTARWYHLCCHSASWYHQAFMAMLSSSSMKNIT